MRELTAQGDFYCLHISPSGRDHADWRPCDYSPGWKICFDADVKDIDVPWIVHEMTGGAKAYPKRETKVDWSKVEKCS